MPLDLPFPPGAVLGAYLRDSGNSRQVLSVPQQEAEIRAWCEARGYILPDELIFRDVARSSKNGVVGRKAFQAMMDYFSNQPQAAGLLLWDFKRWGRDLASSLYWFLDISQRGTPIYIVSEPIPEGPYGLIFVILKLIGADEENKGRAKDVKRGQHYMINRFNGHVGRVNVGYRAVRVPTGEQRDGVERFAVRLEIDPETGPLVAQAFRLRAQGRTLLEIHQETGLRISGVALAELLANPVYLGEWRWGDLERDDIVPPLIDRETFDRCQETIRRTDYGPRRARSSQLLSGLVYCDVCGFRLNIDRAWSGEREHVYYCCPRMFPADARYPCRPSIHHRAGEVDRRVMARLKEILTTPAILSELHARARAQQAHDTPRVSRDDERLAQVRKEIAAITKAIKDGMHTRALAREQAALEDEEYELERRIKTRAARRGPAAIPEALDPEQAAEFGREFWAAVESADLRRRQLVLRSLVERIDIHRDAARKPAGTITLRELPGLGDLSGVVLPL